MFGGVNLSFRRGGGNGRRVSQARAKPRRRNAVCGDPRLAHDHQELGSAHKSAIWADFSNRSNGVPEVLSGGPPIGPPCRPRCTSSTWGFGRPAPSRWKYSSTRGTASSRRRTSPSSGGSWSWSPRPRKASRRSWPPTFPRGPRRSTTWWASAGPPRPQGATARNRPWRGSRLHPRGQSLRPPSAPAHAGEGGHAGSLFPERLCSLRAARQGRGAGHPRL